MSKSLYTGQLLITDKVNKQEEAQCKAKSKSLYTGQLLITAWNDCVNEEFLGLSKSLYTGQLLITLPFTFPFVKTNYYIESADVIKINLKF